jgi:hypothetical protein
VSISEKTKGMRTLASTGIIFLISVSAAAQQRPSPQLRTNTQKDAALYMLKTAEAEANGFEGPMKAAVLFALGHTYSRVDQKKSVELLTAAYDLVNRVSEDAGADLRTLSIEIVRNVAKSAPGTVERSLPSDSTTRDYALEEIVYHYISNRKWSTAEQYYEKIETEPQVYSAARQFLQAIPRSNQELTNQVFFHALRVFGSQQHSEITAGSPEDLGSLLVRFYDRFPSQSVLDAVDELLKQARAENAPEHSQVRTATIAAKTADATVTFSSFYEFRLFQLLPILQALDQQRAEKLLAEAQSAKALLAKYPTGQRGIDPDFSDRASNTSYAIIPLNASAAPTINQLESQRSADEIVKRAETAPQLALPEAEAAPIGVKVPALLGIARLYMKRHPRLSKEALSGVLNATKDDSTGFAWRSVNEAAELFLQMGEDDLAWKACLQASKLISRIYKNDSDGDDPNQALKLFWPSVHAWRDVTNTTCKISVQRTFDILKEIPDQQIQVLEEVMVASAWMNVPVWTDVSPMVFHKDAN